jgi:pSer/pThr/pTyr-binding forkhead associated (FHA) protein
MQIVYLGNNPRVSGVHFRISRLPDDTWEIKDSSTNGTFVNDVSVGKGMTQGIFSYPLIFLHNCL